MLQPIPTRIYRITHLANLPATLRHGIFCRNHPAPATTTYHNIGNASLPNRRGRITVLPALRTTARLALHLTFQWVALPKIGALGFSKSNFFVALLRINTRFG